MVLGDDEGTGVRDQGLGQTLDQSDQLLLLGRCIHGARVDEADLDESPLALSLHPHAGEIVALQRRAVVAYSSERDSRPCPPFWLITIVTS